MLKVCDTSRSWSVLLGVEDSGHQLSSQADLHTSSNPPRGWSIQVPKLFQSLLLLAKHTVWISKSTRFYIIIVHHWLRLLKFDCISTPITLPSSYHLWAVLSSFIIAKSPILICEVSMSCCYIQQLVLSHS